MDNLIRPKDYLKELKKRSKESHVYHKYQLEGLEIADILRDRKHKSLYIKLAKELGGEKILKFAKTIAEDKKIKNKGAYFMWKLKDLGFFNKIKKSRKNNIKNKNKIKKRENEN
jgi:hypothetical protein